MSSISQKTTPKTIIKERKTPYNVEKIAQILHDNLEHLFNVFEYERPSFCDDDIEGFANPIDKLEDIVSLQWEQTDHIVNQELKFESTSFLSEEGISLIAVKSLEGKYIDEGQALLVLRPKDYIFIACIAGHPCIETPFFEYCNSDGSGPILFSTQEMNNPKTLAKYMVEYYGEFFNDNYH